MPAAIIPIGVSHRAVWSLLEVVREPGCAPQPLGVILVDTETDECALRLRHSEEFADAEEPARDILDLLGGDLRAKAREMGGRALLDSLTDSLSNFLRISDPAAMEYAGSAQRSVDRLFDRHVDGEVRRF